MKPLSAVSPFARLKTHTVDLELRTYCTSIAVDRATLRDYPDARAIALREARYELAYYVYGKHHTQVIEYPADWWQAFKARWFPARWLKRWPVKLTRVEVVAEALFPDLAPVEHERRHRIYYVARIANA